MTRSHVRRAADLADWIQQQVIAATARGVVVGLSGGLDSAVVARLCQMAMPSRVLGAVLPCHSDPNDERDADLVATHFGLPVVRIDLAPTYDLLASDLKTMFLQIPDDQAAASGTSTDLKAELPLANIKPRLRMSVLYFMANSLNYLVAGTGNRSELTIGYFTKYGDGAADLLPLGRLLKSEVRELAADLEIPQSIIDKPPSAGLWRGQTDEDEIGFSYSDLERYLTDGPDTVAPALAMRIERLIRSTEHKRVQPLMPEN
jgi:NAD+ synthase